MADLNQKLNKYEKSEEMLLRLLKEKKLKGDLKRKALLNLGDLYFKRGKLNKAKLYLFKALSAFPGMKADIYKKMGYLFVKQGDVSLALRYFNKALQLSGERDISILEQLSSIYIDIGDCASAIQCLEKLIRRRNVFSDYKSLAICLEKMGIRAGGHAHVYFYDCLFCYRGDYYGPSGENSLCR